MAYVVTAYIVMAHMVMAYTVMGYVVMAYTVMAYISRMNLFVQTFMECLAPVYFSIMMAKSEAAVHKVKLLRYIHGHVNTPVIAHIHTHVNTNAEPRPFIS